MNLKNINTLDDIRMLMTNSDNENIEILLKYSADPKYQNQQGWFNLLTSMRIHTWNVNDAVNSIFMNLKDVLPLNQKMSLYSNMSHYFTYWSVVDNRKDLLKIFDISEIKKLTSPEKISFINKFPFVIDLFPEETIDIDLLIEKQGLCMDVSDLVKLIALKKGAPQSIITKLSTFDSLDISRMYLFSQWLLDFGFENKEVCDILKENVYKISKTDKGLTIDEIYIFNKCAGNNLDDIKIDGDGSETVQNPDAIKWALLKDDLNNVFIQAGPFLKNIDFGQNKLKAKINMLLCSFSLYYNNVDERFIQEAKDTLSYFDDDDNHELLQEINNIINTHKSLDAPLRTKEFKRNLLAYLNKVENNISNGVSI